MEYIIPIAILLLPILIPCCIALFVPVSPRLTWVKSICQILLFIAFMICINQVLVHVPNNPACNDNICFFEGRFEARYGMVVRVPILPTLLYFVIYFALVGGACRISKFRYFDHKIMYIIAPALCTLSPFIYNLQRNRGAAFGVLSVTGILILNAILYVVYKKSFKGKKSK